MNQRERDAKEYARKQRNRAKEKKDRHRQKAEQRERRKKRSLWADTRRAEITGGMPAYHDSTPRELRYPPGSKKRGRGWLQG